MRIKFENSTEIGVFTKLTNKYCLCAIGTSDAYYQAIQSELHSKIPIICCTIGGIRIIGRTVVGNAKGILLPQTTTDQEIQAITSMLPESIKVRKIEEKLSALGNCIVCNDNYTLSILK